jgi:hypothetical protein
MALLLDVLAAIVITGLTGAAMALALSLLRGGRYASQMLLLLDCPAVPLPFRAIPGSESSESDEISIFTPFFLPEVFWLAAVLLLLLIVFAVVALLVVVVVAAVVVVVVVVVAAADELLLEGLF